MDPGSNDWSLPHLPEWRTDQLQEIWWFDSLIGWQIADVSNLKKWDISMQKKETGIGIFDLLCAEKYSYVYIYAQETPQQCVFFCKAEIHRYV